MLTTDQHECDGGTRIVNIRRIRTDMWLVCLNLMYVICMKSEKRRSGRLRIGLGKERCECFSRSGRLLFTLSQPIGCHFDCIACSSGFLSARPPRFA
jgi:hypothetical protein